MHNPEMYRILMIWLDLNTPLALRPKKDLQQHSDAESESEAAPSPQDEASWIVCRQCRQRLTQANHGLSVDGSHQHTFANPSGVVFEIACYYPVSGISLVGSTSSEFAWFSGHTWQIGICATCRTHLGWLFRDASTQVFYALIVDRIMEESTSV